MIFLSCIVYATTPAPAPAPSTPAPAAAPVPVSATTVAPSPTHSAPSASNMVLKADMPPDSAAAIADIMSEPSLVPVITDIPSTFTFRASCIKTTYIDGFYKKQLNEPMLIRKGNGLYILHATCLNGLGVPVETKITLKLIIRHIGDIRTISIRSIVDHSKRYRNCADIANLNGVLECVPADKFKHHTLHGHQKHHKNFRFP